MYEYGMNVSFWVGRYTTYYEGPRVDLGKAAEQHEINEPSDRTRSGGSSWGDLREQESLQESG